jgi:hypothetical protein
MLLIQFTDFVPIAFYYAERSVNVTATVVPTGRMRITDIAANSAKVAA